VDGSDLWRADRLDTRLAQGRLAAGHIEALARELARWHAESAAAGATAAETPAALAGRIEPTRSDRLDAARADLARAVAVDAARFAERAAAGALRRIHGALALEAAYVDSASRVSFEMPASLEAGDPALDVAALALALRRVSRGDLADRFVAAYAEAADDFALYGVLGFYDACVALAHAARTGDARWLDGVRTQAAGRPTLVVVDAGRPRAQTARLAAELGAPLVSADRLRAPDLDAWSRFLELARRAAVVLDAGRSVVLETALESPSMQRVLARLARDRGATLVVADRMARERSGRKIARVGPRPAHPTERRSTPL
jgi:hypothetical protein